MHPYFRNIAYYRASTEYRGFLRGCELHEKEYKFEKLCGSKVDVDNLSQLKMNNHLTF